MDKVIKNESGLTLLEIIIAIAIISMVGLTFMMSFSMSARTNVKARTTLDASYLGKDAMEMIYNNLGKINPYSHEEMEFELEKEGYSYNDEELKLKLREEGYSDSDGIYSKKFNHGKVLTIKLEDEGKLIRVLVRVFKDDSLISVEAQYETLYFQREGSPSHEG